jgi:hypothetical protein
VPPPVVFDLPFFLPTKRAPIVEELVAFKIGSAAPASALLYARLRNVFFSPLVRAALHAAAERSACERFFAQSAPPRHRTFRSRTSAFTF